MKDKKDLNRDLLRTLVGDCCKESKEPDDAKVIATIKKFIKNAEETLKCIGTEVGKVDTYSKHKQEINILESYLPKQLSEADIRELLGLCRAEGYDMGRAMRHFKEKFSGLYDGKFVSTLAKEILG